jgi:hypothetical protein
MNDQSMRVADVVADIKEVAQLALNAGRQAVTSLVEKEVGTARAGAGTSTEVRAASRLTIRYGGMESDWAKMTSSSYKGEDGFRMATHWYENLARGERFEPKTKMMWLP